MVLVPLTLEVRLIKLVLLNRGSHGTINHQNALSEELVNHTIVGRGLDGGFEWLVHGDGTQVLWRGQGVMISGVALWLKSGSIFENALSGIISSIQKHILNITQEL